MIYGADCSMGSNCTDNIIYGDYITFGTGSNALINYCSNITVERGCKYIKLYTTDTTASAANKLQNVVINTGVTGSSNYNQIDVEIPDRNLGYLTEIILGSNGNAYSKVFNGSAEVYTDLEI